MMRIFFLQFINDNTTQTDKILIFETLGLESDLELDFVSVFTLSLFGLFVFFLYDNVVRIIS